MAGFDYKNMGLKVLDVVVGVGAAVAGAKGGPEAAKGVMMAGNAIKSGVNEATGDGSRADRHDRADFQARDATLVRKREAAVTANDDAAVSRAELIRLGWSPERADEILSGPSEEVSLASLLGSGDGRETAPATSESPRVRPRSGQSLASAKGTRLPESEGSVVKGTEGSKVDEYEGSTTLASLGKVVSGVLGKKV